jgi:hypothetical protein
MLKSVEWALFRVATVGVAGGRVPSLKSVAMCTPRGVSMTKVACPTKVRPT